MKIGQELHARLKAMKTLIQDCLSLVDECDDSVTVARFPGLGPRVLACAVKAQGCLSILTQYGWPTPECCGSREG